MARMKQGVFSWEDVLAHRYQNNKPAALPRVRRSSALSSRSQNQPQKQPDTRLAWDIQSESSLLAKLSPELRVMIWEEVLGGMRIHIVQQADKRMGHVVCRTESCDICRSGLPSGCSCNREGLDNLLALPMVCKQTYSESIHLLYTLNTFEFSNTWSLPYFRPTIPSEFWDSIRVVELSWAFPGHWLPSKDPVKTVYFSAGRQQWLEVCSAVIRMKGLQSFTLQLSGSWFCESVEKLPVFLEPLAQVRLKKRWTLQLPRQPYYVKEIKSIDADLKKRGIDCVVLAV
ncbi:hypothetical protein BDV18DRAFT_128472 [Aspergillus unguis]